MPADLPPLPAGYMPKALGQHARSSALVCTITMGRCPQAPCAGLANQEDYLRTVGEVALFLEGKQEG